MNDTVSTITTVVTASDTTIGYVPRSYITSTIPYPTIVGTININTPTSDKKMYRCAYCGTLHEHNTGTCDKCGAEIMGDYYYANIEEYGDKWCEDCYNEAYEEWLGEHRRVL